MGAASIILLLSLVLFRHNTVNLSARPVDINNMTKNSQNNLLDGPDAIMGLVEGKDQQELCREVLAIGDTMDVLRGKWTVEVLTAIVCGNTHFKEILASIHGLSDKVLAERLPTAALCSAERTLRQLYVLFSAIMR